MTAGGERRSLPGPIIDRVRDGVPRQVLRRARCGGDCAVWEALVATAMSALQRGWTFGEWVALLDDPRSRLGTQAKIKGRGYRVLSARAHHKRLTRAWQRAGRNVTEHPASEYAAEVQDRIAEVRAWVGEAPFSADHRTLMIDACEQAAKLGTWRPALPWRQAAERTGLTGRRVKDGYRELCEDGVLTLVARGRPGEGRSSGRANVYRLPAENARTLSLCRGTRPKDQDHALTRPKDQDQKDPTTTMGQDHGGTRPKDQDHRREGAVADDTVTLTVRGASLEAVLAALRERGLTASAELPDNVTPIKREDRGAT